MPLIRSGMLPKLETSFWVIVWSICSLIQKWRKIRGLLYVCILCLCESGFNARVESPSSCSPLIITVQNGTFWGQFVQKLRRKVRGILDVNVLIQYLWCHLIYRRCAHAPDVHHTHTLFIFPTETKVLCFYYFFNRQEITKKNKTKQNKKRLMRITRPTTGP